MKKIAETDTTRTYTDDEPDHEIGAGANHKYVIYNKNNLVNINPLTRIKFQKGHVEEHGITGIRDVDLMWILKHRLEAFQAGEHACPENEIMLTHINAMIMTEGKRTADREARNVEGTSQK